jgi:N-dimethylarginine dimethylaminohydrolase
MLVYGNTFYGAEWDYRPCADIVAEYRKDPRNRIVERQNKPGAGWINGANTVRAGRDIYLDSHYDNSNGGANYNDIVKQLFSDYRVHLLSNGGHVDGCFAAIKPGVLLTCEYFEDYARTFPGWECININEREFLQHNLTWRKGPPLNGKWWLPGVTESAKFNEHIIKHAQDWVGDYTETYFEVNCLVIDEHNVFMLGENEGVFRELERHGITAHAMPFRTRTFWDGGLHCITLDIRRRDSQVDLFPERGNQSIFNY